MSRIQWHETRDGIVSEGGRFNITGKRKHYRLHDRRCVFMRLFKKLEQAKQFAQRLVRQGA